MEKAREEGLGVKFRPTFASPLPAPMRQENGRLGHGDEENQFTPRLVSAAVFNGERVVIVFVAAGGHHMVAPVGGANPNPTSSHPLSDVGSG